MKKRIFVYSNFFSISIRDNYYLLLVFANREMEWKIIAKDLKKKIRER